MATTTLTPRTPLSRRVRSVSRYQSIRHRCEVMSSTPYPCSFSSVQLATRISCTPESVPAAGVARPVGAARSSEAASPADGTDADEGAAWSLVGSAACAGER